MILAAKPLIHPRGSVTVWTQNAGGRAIRDFYGLGVASMFVMDVRVTDALL